MNTLFIITFHFLNHFLIELKRFKYLSECGLIDGGRWGQRP